MPQDNTPERSVNSSPPALKSASRPTYMQRRSRIGLVAGSLDIIGGQEVQAKILRDRLRDEGYDVNFIPINPVFPRGLKWLRRLPYLRTILNEAFYIPSL